MKNKKKNNKVFEMMFLLFVIFSCFSLNKKKILYIYILM